MELSDLNPVIKSLHPLTKIGLLHTGEKHKYIVCFYAFHVYLAVYETLTDSEFRSFLPIGSPTPT